MSIATIRKVTGFTDYFIKTTINVRPISLPFPNQYDLKLREAYYAIRGKSVELKMHEDET